MSTEPRVDFIANVNSSAVRLSSLLDSYIRKKNPNVWKADSTELSRRIRQLILRENHYSLYHQLLNVQWPNVHLEIESGGKVSFHPSVGFSVGTSGALVFRKMARMFAVWSISLLKVFWNLFRSKVRIQNLSIVRYPHLVDYIPEKKILGEFYDFCFDGKFDFLKQSDFVICSHSENVRSQDGKLVLTKENPFLVALERVPYSLWDVFWYVGISVSMLFRFAFLCLEFPVASLLANDVAFWPLVRLLDRVGGLKNVVINTSQLYDQEIWLHSDAQRGYRSRCIWYGMSVRELVFKDVKPVEWPALQLFKCDHNYLWNEFHQKDVRELLPQSGEHHLVYSNLWYKPDFKTVPRTRKRVVLFITNPKKSEVMWKNFTPNFYYYGSYEVQEQLYSGVIRAVREYESSRGEKVDVLIKLKRFLDNPIYDSRMSDLTTRMERDGCQFFDLNDHDAKDLYHEIFNSDLTICTPMSTPNFLAAELGKSGIYYDPTGKIVAPDGLAEYKISWASNAKDFSHKLAEILDQASARATR